MSAEDETQNTRAQFEQDILQIRQALGSTRRLSGSTSESEISEDEEDEEESEEEEEEEEEGEKEEDEDETSIYHLETSTYQLEKRRNNYAVAESERVEPPSVEILSSDEESNEDQGRSIQGVLNWFETRQSSNISWSDNVDSKCATVVSSGDGSQLLDSTSQLLDSTSIGSQQSNLTLLKPRRSHTSPFTIVNPVQQVVQTPEISDQPSSEILTNQRLSLPPTVASHDSRFLPSTISSYLGNCPISPVLPSQNSVETSIGPRSANVVWTPIDAEQVCSSPNSTSLMNLDTDSDNYTITELRSSSQSISSAASFSQTAQQMNDINHIAQCTGFAAAILSNTVESDPSYSITSNNESKPFMQEEMQFSQVNDATNDGDSTHPLTLAPQYSNNINSFDDDLAGLNDVEKNLKLNRIYQALIVAELKRIELLLAKNRETREKQNLQQLTANFQDQSGKLESRTLVKFSYPYFRDKSNMGPPGNEDTLERQKCQQVNPYEKTAAVWNVKEKATLAEAVRMQNLEHKLSPLMERLRELENDGCEQKTPDQLEEVRILQKNIQEIKNLPESKLEEDLADIDWDKLATIYLPRRTACECRLQWCNVQHPKINNGPWTKQEDKMLLCLAQSSQRMGWDRIAEALQTRRTAFQCIQRYQRSLNPNLMKSSWTAEEDVLLERAVRAYGGSDWQKVALFVEGRTGAQCMHRWQKTINPVIRKGKWSSEEDKILRVAVEKHGPGNWKALAKDITGRTGTQCRERWANVLNPNIIKGKWTAKDDKLLLDLVDKYHEGNWSKISRDIGTRTDNQCWRRWMVLRKNDSWHYRENAQRKKKLMSSYFGRRKALKPTIGPEDMDEIPDGLATPKASTGRPRQNNPNKAALKKRQKYPEKKSQSEEPQLASTNSSLETSQEKDEKAPTRRRVRMPHHKTLMKQWQLEQQVVLKQVKEDRHQSASMLYERVPGFDVDCEEKGVEKKESPKLCAIEKTKVKSKRPLVPFSLLLQAFSINVPGVLSKVHPDESSETQPTCCLQTKSVSQPSTGVVNNASVPQSSSIPQTGPAVLQPHIGTQQTTTVSQSSSIPQTGYPIPQPNTSFQHSITVSRSSSIPQNGIPVSQPSTGVVNITPVPQSSSIPQNGIPVSQPRIGAQQTTPVSQPSSIPQTGHPIPQSNTSFQHIIPVSRSSSISQNGIPVLQPRAKIQPSTPVSRSSNFREIRPAVSQSRAGVLYTTPAGVLCSPPVGVLCSTAAPQSSTGVMLKSPVSQPITGIILNVPVSQPTILTGSAVLQSTTSASPRNLVSQSGSIAQPTAAVAQSTSRFRPLLMKPISMSATCSALRTSIIAKRQTNIQPKILTLTTADAVAGDASSSHNMSTNSKNIAPSIGNASNSSQETPFGTLQPTENMNAVDLARPTASTQVDKAEKSLAPKRRKARKRKSKEEECFTPVGKLTDAPQQLRRSLRSKKQRITILNGSDDDEIDDDEGTDDDFDFNQEIETESEKELDAPTQIKRSKNDKKLVGKRKQSSETEVTSPTSSKIETGSVPKANIKASPCPSVVSPTARNRTSYSERISKLKSSNDEAFTEVTSPDYLPKGNNHSTTPPPSVASPAIKDSISLSEGIAKLISSNDEALAGKDVQLPEKTIRKKDIKATQSASGLPKEKTSHSQSDSSNVPSHSQSDSSNVTSHSQSDSSNVPIQVPFIPPLPPSVTTIKAFQTLLCFKEALAQIANTKKPRVTSARKDVSGNTKGIGVNRSVGQQVSGNSSLATSTKTSSTTQLSPASSPSALASTSKENSSGMSTSSLGLTSSSLATNSFCPNVSSNRQSQSQRRKVVSNYRNTREFHVLQSRFNGLFLWPALMSKVHPTERVPHFVRAKSAGMTRVCKKPSLETGTDGREENFISGGGIISGPGTSCNISSAEMVQTQNESESQKNPETLRHTGTARNRTNSSHIVTKDTTSHPINSTATTNTTRPVEGSIEKESGSLIESVRTRNLQNGTKQKEDEVSKPNERNQEDKESLSGTTGTDDIVSGKETCSGNLNTLANERTQKDDENLSSPTSCCGNDGIVSAKGTEICTRDAGNTSDDSKIDGKNVAPQKRVRSTTMFKKILVDKNAIKRQRAHTKRLNKFKEKLQSGFCSSKSPAQDYITGLKPQPLAPVRKSKSDKPESDISGASDHEAASTPQNDGLVATPSSSETVVNNIWRADSSCKESNVSENFSTSLRGSTNNKSADGNVSKESVELPKNKVISNERLVSATSDCVVPSVSLPDKQNVSPKPPQDNPCSPVNTNNGFSHKHLETLKPFSSPKASRRSSRKRCASADTTDGTAGACHGAPRCKRKTISRNVETRKDDKN